MTVSKAGYDSATCTTYVEVNDPTPPSCDAFTADPSTLLPGGGNVTLSWETTNADFVTIDNGVGTVAEDGSTIVSVASDINYILTVYEAGYDPVTCTVSIDVIPAPSCDFLTASTESLPYGGGDVTLTWETSHAPVVTIDNGIGIVDPDGSIDVTVTDDITYTLTAAKPGTLSDTCMVSIDVAEPQAPSCDAFYATPDNLAFGGGDVVLTWDTTNAGTVSIDNGVGTVAADGSTVVPVTDDTTYTLTVSKPGYDPVTCMTSVEVAEPEYPSCDAFYATPNNLPFGGGDSTLTWETTNADFVTIDNGIGAVSNDGSTPVTVTDDTTYTMTVSRVGYDPVTCTTDIDVALPPLSCASNVTFTADPNSLPYGGGNVELTWEAVGVDAIAIDYGVLATTSVLSGDTIVSIVDDFVYTLTATRGDEFVNCPLVIAVDEVEPDPISCSSNVAFTADPMTLGAGGGDVELTWTTTDIDSVKLDGAVVGLNESATTSITETTTFNLEVVGDSTTAGNTEICPVTVTVADEVFSCANNVLFTADDTSLPRGGGDVLFTWSTIGADSLSINGISSIALDGSEVVRVDDDKTFTLTALKDGFDPISCPISINVDSGGGGGGGSSRPRCELLASDKNIDAGDVITLSWETRRGRELYIYEGDPDDDNKIFETEENDQVDEGEIKVRPTRDTEYTLVVERGSRKQECEVKINVDDTVVLSSARVAGISLSQVPYTGFEAGPVLTMIFYAMLALWALFVSYLVVIKGDTVLGISLAGAFPRGRVIEDVSTEESTEAPEASVAEAYVEAVTPQIPVHEAPTIPGNLPTSVAPVIGYQADDTVTDIQYAHSTVSGQTDEMKELEDCAHTHKVLLSSDAMRHFTATCPREVNRLTYLEQMITEARVSYPSEDGWVVLNLERMQELCEKRSVPTEPHTVEASEEVQVDVAAVSVPNGTGSLAESIVTGNIAAAYQMIGARPMFALADAAADLDAVYRGRKGDQVVISDMLAKETARLETSQIEEAINALTSAIDGTYTDEAAAVKMAIIKATKALS